MQIKTTLWAVATVIALVTGAAYAREGQPCAPVRSIVTSDTILSGMAAALLPPERYRIKAILPPGQCPGHYDVKLTDIEKLRAADLSISFKGMPFMEKAGPAGKARVLVDAQGRNWMVPAVYMKGLGFLCGELSECFAEDAGKIRQHRDEETIKIRTHSQRIIEKIKRSGGFGSPVIASAMQTEPLKWMGFLVVAQYGRQESISAREFVRLLDLGKSQQAVMVVDNLQSGPEVGKGIAESLGIPHVVLTNFPSEKGYPATLAENIEAVLAALEKR